MTPRVSRLHLVPEGQQLPVLKPKVVVTGIQGQSDHLKYPKKGQKDVANA